MAKDKNQKEQQKPLSQTKKTLKESREGHVTNTERVRKGNAGDTENTGPRKK